MKNTTLIIKNEHGEYSVSAPISVTFDEHLNLFVSLMNLSGFHQKSIDRGIVDMAHELTEEFDVIVNIEKTSTGYSAYYNSYNGLVSSTGDTIAQLLVNLSDATLMSED